MSDKDSLASEGAAVTPPPTNVDYFRRIPRREITALLPSQESAVSAWSDVIRSGIKVSRPRILQGVQGVRILDVRGTKHGRAARLWRIWQNLGTLENAFAVYSEGLSKGKALLSVACSRDVAGDVAQMFQARGGTAMMYFGRDSSELLSGPYLRSPAADGGELTDGSGLAD
jgi:hypothetical protein